MIPAPRYDDPSEAELARRVEHVRTGMLRAGLSHSVVANPDNVYYLTNFANYVHERPFILIVPQDGPLQFVVPKLEIPHVETRSVGPIELLEYAEFPAPFGSGWAERFSPLLPAGAGIGVEASCPLQILEAIPGPWTRSDLVEDARAVKSPYEIGRIAYSSAVVCEAMRILLDMAKPGVGLMEVYAACRGHMLLKTLGDNPTANPLATNAASVFQPPSVSHDPHNFTDVSMKMVEGGPHVAIINGTLNGYGSEVERSFFIGGAPAAAKRPYEVMMAARRAAFERLRPGESMASVDAACNAVFQQAGYGDALLHRTGHGIGVTGHEGPFLAEGDQREIRPGMVFTIEPGLYLPGLGGFRHSDTVLTTETGCVSLTPLPDDLAALTLPL